MHWSSTVVHAGTLAILRGRGMSKRVTKRSVAISARRKRTARADRRRVRSLSRAYRDGYRRKPENRSEVTAAEATALPLLADEPWRNDAQ